MLVNEAFVYKTNTVENMLYIILLLTKSCKILTNNMKANRD